ncbi:MAG: hypothetical protein K9N09_00110 [Candidatus Cloacimonetes bacterium]|nr:hypothetical protein [Candidatus Cloacimonadota bacterium]MCF7812865.1 hypothetical protein [Candidatus Cloacimonadota bacterium]MCF7867077.1 hypothetical protein [Candidatus Cloacimonadota bacterium]MCF7882603.1 hypothetical protein [Candidatus Cloacimonadota bacterium]
MKYFIAIMLLAVVVFGCQTKKDEVKTDLEDTKQDIKKETVQDSLKDQAKPEETEKVQKEEIEETDQKEEVEEDEWLSQQKLWDLYNAAKAKVKEAEKNNNFEAMSKFYHEAAIYANALERNDIEAWQYNNAAYYLIKEFKVKTDYQTKMDSLNSLKLKQKIEDYRLEIQKNFREESRLLSKAKGYLEKAKEVDAELEKSDRTRIIANNISFVDFVLEFVEMGEPDQE